MYFGFVTGYTKKAFAYNDFYAQYTSGIYRFRVLSRELLITVYNFINSNFNFNDTSFEEITRQLDENGSPAFYLSYYVFNTFFLVLTLWVVFFIFQAIFDNLRVTIIYNLAFCFIICFSQYVVVPYDCLVYFFLMLSIYLILKIIAQPKLLYLGLLSLSILLGGLTRETIVLALSFYGALIYCFYKGKVNIKPYIMNLILLSLIYGLVYLGLRIKLGFDAGITDNLGSWERLQQNFTRLDKLMSLGLFIGAVFIIFVLINGEEKETKVKASLVFLVLSLPYILPILYTGNLFEFRLFVPLILVILVLANLDYKQLTYSKVKN